MHWSNGVVEGHVNRLKSIKRQMYGRTCFEPHPPLKSEPLHCKSSTDQRLCEAYLPDQSL